MNCTYYLFINNIYDPNSMNTKMVIVNTVEITQLRTKKITKAMKMISNTKYKM